MRAELTAHFEIYLHPENEAERAFLKRFEEEPDRVQCRVRYMKGDRSRSGAVPDQSGMVVKCMRVWIDQS